MDPHHIYSGDLFVTRSPTPYEVELKSPLGEELETLSLHVASPHFQTDKAVTFHMVKSLELIGVDPILLGEK